MNTVFGSPIFMTLMQKVNSCNSHCLRLSYCTQCSMIPGLGLTHVNLTKNLIGGNPYESGALFSYANNPTEINIRVGVSFVSAEQACQNAETEIGNATFSEIRQRSVDLWNEKLGKVEISVGDTNPNVTEMLYSSLYRSFLTPNNATGEGQGLFANTTSPYFDSLYCSWDTVSDFSLID